MKNYQIKTKEFIFENYHKNKPFASFLPGIAGKTGVPMWTYYVNRGQLISSFGIENKDHALLDFTPANLSYQQTPLKGFRTFVKINGKTYEPFGLEDSSRTLKIGMNHVSITDQHKLLETSVKYFNLTEENFPGLVRKVTFKAKKDIQLEILDGLATIWPYGTSLFVQKNMANLAVAWFDVFNTEHKMPFMKNRSTTEDSEEVGTVEQGNFYVTVDEFSQRLKPIYDPTLVFGQRTDLILPDGFNASSYEDFIKEEQVSVNQLLSAFSTNKVELKKNQYYTFYTLLGSYENLDGLNEVSQSFTFEYFKRNELKAQEVIETLTQPLEVKTSHPIFDAYMKQAFLDNLLRGGYPYLFKSKNGYHVYHTFSRIHGDMEREYNNFYVEPSFFSHGNGSYRDVNQNRRNDIYFVKEAGLFNLKQFIELIQLDGHNPLTIQGSRFHLDDKSRNLLVNKLKISDTSFIKTLERGFTPGEIFKHALKRSNNKEQALSELNQILQQSEQTTESSFGTGYWSDHWIYNLDLLDLYLNIYPDKLKSMLFEETVRFYQSHMSVFPRRYKYVINHQGEVRQLGAMYQDDEKIKKLGLKQSTNFHKDSDDSVVRVNLFTKFLHLSLIKFSSLDPMGMGIMMDSEKPGWNDAMNGLPAIFGSGLTETINLYKLLNYLHTWIKNFGEETINIPKDIYVFMENIIDSMPHGFHKIQDARESFDEKTRFVMDKASVHVDLDSLKKPIQQMIEFVEKGLEEAKKLGHGLIPTYLTFEALDYHKNGLKHPHLKLDAVDVKSFKVRPLPAYLEAPAHFMKSLATKEEALKMSKLIDQSGIYDEKLGLYKTSASLETETLSIGRARAFTPGWLEREASFVHMSYKYLIGLFKSGLYDQYYEAIKTGMIPFMDPLVYGRSTLENVSFIATSNNPNPKNHGRGFVARLTGTTSEAITLLYLMFIGKHPFTYENNTLNFKVSPKLKAWLFKDGQVSIKFLGKTEIIILNPKNQDTFNQKVLKYELIGLKAKFVVEDDKVSNELAEDIRNEKFKKIIVTLG